MAERDGVAHHPPQVGQREGRRERLAAGRLGRGEERVGVEDGQGAAGVHGDRRPAGSEAARLEDPAGGGVQHVHAQPRRGGILRGQGVEAAIGPDREGHVHDRQRERQPTAAGGEEDGVSLVRAQTALGGPQSAAGAVILADLVASEGPKVERTPRVRRQGAGVGGTEEKRRAGDVQLP